MPVGASPAPGHPASQVRRNGRLSATGPRAIGSAAVTPHQHRVTKTGFIGNDDPVFFGLPSNHENHKSLKTKDLQKLARHLLYLWHNNNKNA
jgi:hypothetical protein